MAKNLVKTRIPTAYGDFTLYLYAEHGKEHLALVKGDVGGQTAVPVRVHSECLTGDVFGSRRCDCGDQLKHTLHYLGRANCGILVYLRQEGRGIGLRKKMEAYNLQDTGMDTVEANLHLGHQADERDYGIAARILKSLDVRSIRLITNNPHKVDELVENGVTVEARIPIEVGQHEDNLGYLRSKAEKMAHWLTFSEHRPEYGDLEFLAPLVDQLSLARNAADGGPFVTLAYAQGLDGGFAAQAQVPLLAHYLRTQHDAFLVAGDSALNSAAADAQRVVIDSRLSLAYEPLPAPPAIIITTAAADSARREALGGVKLIVAAADAEGEVDLADALGRLRDAGIRTLLVEGDAGIIRACLRQRLANYGVLTIAPKFLGGASVAAGENALFPALLADCQYQILGSDVIAHGPVGYG